MNIEDLIIKLHIEEDNRESKRKRAHPLTKVNVNFMEHGQSSRVKKKKNKGKGTKLKPK